MKTNIFTTRREAIKVKFFIILFLIAFFSIARIARGQGAALQTKAEVQTQNSDNWVSQMSHVADLLNLYADELSQRAIDMRAEAAKTTDASASAILRKKADACDALAGEKRNERGVLLVIIDKAATSPRIVALNDK